MDPQVEGDVGGPSSPGRVGVGLNTTLASVHTDVDFPFRFQTPYRSVNWRSLSAVDVDTIQRDGDVPQLLTHMQDVMYGDCSHRDVVADDRLKRTLLLAQYTTQYLNYCTETLQTSCDEVTATLRQREQELQAATQEYEDQRSRRLELKREKRHLDDEITLYFSLLRKVNPGLYARIRVLKDGSLAIAPLPTDVKHEAPRAHVVSRGTMPEPRQAITVATSPPPSPPAVLKRAQSPKTPSNVFAKPEVHRAPVATMPTRRTLLRPTGIPPPAAESHPPPTEPAFGAPSARERDLMRSLEGTVGSSIGARLRHAGVSPRGAGNAGQR